MALTGPSWPIFRLQPCGTWKGDSRSFACSHSLPSQQCIVTTQQETRLTCGLLRGGRAKTLYQFACSDPTGFMFCVGAWKKKIIHNRWAHLKLIRCRGGNSGNCVTVSIVIGLSINPCCSPGQSKHRPSSIFSMSMHSGGWYQFVQCSLFHWIKLQAVKEARFRTPAGFIFTPHCVWLYRIQFLQKASESPFLLV